VTRVVIFDRKEHEDTGQRLTGDFSEIDELSGNLARNTDDQKLMHSVLESDKDKIDKGMLISDSINQGIGSFTPDLMFEKVVKDFKEAKRLFGDSILRELTGYDPSYIEKNLALPEFRRQLKDDIAQRVEALKKDGLVSKEGLVTERGVRLASLVLFVQELDHLVLRGLGEKEDREKSRSGEREDVRPFNHERYRDLALRPSILTAIKRGHEEIHREDLRVYERRKRGKITIIYGMDSSGSMKGDKLGMAKKAGIALSYKAILEKNKVGLIVFDSEVRKEIPPTTNFAELLDELARARAGLQTNLKNAIEKSIELFPKGSETKHLVLITDALPTEGRAPEEETLRAASLARDQKITISIIGISLDKKGQHLAKKITELGLGRLFIVKDVKELDTIILEDYESLVHESS
jgi:Mg-chelatase subunit ChlD